MSKEITLYVKTGCPYCKEKIEEFNSKRVPFKEINITEKPEAKEELLRMTGGKRMVPVIVEGNKISIAPDGG